MWIRKVLIFILLALLLEAGDCWKIKDKDLRALCESKFEYKKSCWKIKDKDRRAYCEASAYKKKSCWKIQNNDVKVMCQVETGN